MAGKLIFKNCIFIKIPTPKLKAFFIIIIFFLLVTNSLKSQLESNDYVTESRLTLQSIDKSFNPFLVATEFSFMVLNLTNGDFLLQTDASKLVTGNIKLDSILQSKGSQQISFKGNIADNLFLFSKKNEEEKFYNMNGQLIINNLSVNCVAQFNVINYAEKSDQQGYRMDFNLSVDPGKLVIYGLENKINKQLTITVKGGKLNTRQ